MMSRNASCLSVVLAILMLDILGVFSAVYAQEDGDDEITCEDLANTYRLALVHGFSGRYTLESSAFEQLRAAYESPETQKCFQDATGSQKGDALLPREPQLLSYLALSESNRRRFITADGLFDLARESLERNGDDDESRNLYNLFRVFHFLNREEDHEAYLEAYDLIRTLDDPIGFVVGDDLAFRRGRDDRFDLQRVADSLPLYVSARAFYALGCPEGGGVTCEYRRQARRAIEQAIALVDERNTLQSTVYARYRLLQSQIFLDADEFGSAENAVDDAISAWSNLSVEGVPERYKGAVSNSPLLAGAHFLKGRILAEKSLIARSEENVREALAAYEPGFEILKQSPGGMGFDPVWPYLSAAYNLAQRSDDAERAALEAQMFSAVQLVRKTSAAQSIAESAGQFVVDSDPQIRAAYDRWQMAKDDELKARSQLALAEQQFGASSSEARYARTALQSFVRKTTQSEERFSRLDGGSFSRRLQQPVTAEEIMAELAADGVDNSAFVLVASGDRAATGFVFRVDESGLRVRQFDRVVGTRCEATKAETATSCSVRERVGNIMLTLTEISGSNWLDFPLTESHALYAQVFGTDDQPDAIDLTANDLLYSVAIGELENAPLSLLVTRLPDVPYASLQSAGYDYSRFDFLLKETAIVQLPSAQTLTLLAAAIKDEEAGGDDDGRSRPLGGLFRNDVASAGVAPLAAGADRKGVLLAGGFDFPESMVDLVASRFDATTTCRDFATSLSELKRFKKTEGYFEQVAGIVGRPTILYGDQFTEDAITRLSEQGELAGYEVVHFHTHGVLPTVGECLSEPFVTVTTRADDPGSTPGMLTAREIEQLKLDARLVIVAACNSGGTSVLLDGRTAEGGGRRRVSLGEAGESLSGLARAFFDAGAKSAIVSYWSVSEAYTRIMLRDFYRFARDGASIAEAHRQSALILLAEPRSSHPFFWSGFVVVGGGQQRLELAEGAEDFDNRVGAPTSEVDGGASTTGQ